MGVDFSTREEVRREASEFRRKHGALDWSVRIDQLIRLNGYSYGSYSPFGVGGTLRAAIDKLGKKVKALVSIKDRVILTAFDLHQAKKPFAKGHELGHSVLPWHQEILYACDEHDLSPKARNQLEFEANEFSSEILVPTELLKKVYPQYPICMKTVLAIHEWSGASIEACANAYVSKHPYRCVLLVMEEKTLANGTKVLDLKRKVVSRPAVKDEMSTIAKQQTFPPQHNLFAASRQIGDVQTCNLNLTNAQKRLRASLINNGYRVLALVFD